MAELSILTGRQGRRELQLSAIDRSADRPLDCPAGQRVAAAENARASEKTQQGLGFPSVPVGIPASHARRAVGHGIIPPSIRVEVHPLARLESLEIPRA